MTQLAAAQRRMHATLIHPLADPNAASTLFRSGGRLGPSAGLAIYQRGYFLRIAACMREQFPALCHALGRALFDDFVADYIRDCPPERHTLYDLGRRFPAWLQANRPEPQARERWVEFMIDLAEFEYALFSMFDMAGHEGKPFATRDTPDRDLRLQPAFALGRYGFPVAAYYHAVRRGEAPRLPIPSPTHVALVRRDYRIRTVLLTPGHYTQLRALQSGEPITFSAERERWIDWGFFVTDPGGSVEKLASSPED
ncbi:DNA-binding domain-containing protein [Sphingomonas sp. ST-64]|uniref:DNA-binding domain-containing protein n=1 Tax=Sphingomonas plantiphila TaxID=3163295 RepID=A0ABW8YQH1_9SPHN